jgi:hypothetical protein
MIHRHLASPRHTLAALDDLLENGTLADWRPVLVRVRREPDGEVARGIMTLLGRRDDRETGALWRACIAKARTDRRKRVAWLRLPADDGLERHGVGGDRTVEEPAEEHSTRLAAAPVESQHELVEIRVEVSVTHGSVMRAEPPAIKPRRDEMNAGQPFAPGLA